MRWMIDLNVVLDVFQRREPFYAASAQILSKVLALASAAERDENVEVIVTRNVKDFDRSPIPAMTPGELLVLQARQTK